MPHTDDFVEAKMHHALMYARLDTRSNQVMVVSTSDFEMAGAVPQIIDRLANQQQMLIDKIACHLMSGRSSVPILRIPDTTTGAF